MMTTRQCKICDTVKPLEDFPVSDTKRGYRRHWCTVCYSSRKKGYYNANYEAVRGKQNARAKRVYNADKKKHQSQSAEWARKYRAEYRAKVIAAYGSECACCGETVEQFLTVDHVHNDGYEARKQKLHPADSAGFYRWLSKNGFPPEFQLLCMNCNFGKAKNGGVCPHQEGSTTIPQGSTAQAIGAGSASHPALVG